MSTTTATAPELEFRGAAPWRRALRQHGWTIAVWLVFLAMVPYWRSLTQQDFKFDLQALAIDALPLCLAAMAQAVIVISGGIDLSIGSLMGVVNALSAREMVDMSFRQALLFSLLVILLTVLASGFTGLIITLTRIPDIVVTLGMLFVWQGVALWIMEIPGGGVPSRVLGFGDRGLPFLGDPERRGGRLRRAPARVGAPALAPAGPRAVRGRFEPQLRVPERCQRRSDAGRRLHARRRLHGPGRACARPRRASAIPTPARPTR